MAGRAAKREARRARGAASRIAGRRREVLAALLLMAKGYRILGFRLQDGGTLWEYPASKTPRAEAEYGDPEGFSLRDGVAYALLSTGDLVAIEASTGRPRWVRKTQGGGTPVPATFLFGDQVITGHPDTLGAARCADGKPTWSGEGYPSGPVIPCSHHPGDDPPLFVTEWNHPRDERDGHPLLSVHSLDGLLAVDPSSLAICCPAASVSNDMRFHSPPRCSITIRTLI